MGQRLVISIENNRGEKLATQYMHWSAYTGDTLECLKDIHDAMEKLGTVREETEYAVALLRKAFPGAALTPPAASALGMTESRALSRNAGLIDVTEDEMEDSMGWAEGSAHITLADGVDPDDLGWYLDVYWKDELKDWLDEVDDEIYKLNPEKGGMPLLKHDAATDEWKPVPAHKLDFDGWAETWDQVRRIDDICTETYSDGFALCYQEDSEGEAEYFILHWIG